MYTTIKTADDEEPNCGRCNHINAADEWCYRFCGAENGWNCYEREVEEDDTE